MRMKVQDSRWLQYNKEKYDLYAYLVINLPPQTEIFWLIGYKKITKMKYDKLQWHQILDIT